MRGKFGRLCAVLVAGLFHVGAGAFAIPRPALAAAPKEAPSALRGHGGPVKALALIDGGRTLVTGSFDSTIIVWDPATGSARRVLRFHGSTVNALSPLPGGCFASGGEDGRIAVWCGGATTPTRVLDGHTAPVTALALAPDGRHLASAAFDRTVRLWPVGPDGGAPRTLETGAAPVNALAFLPDGAALVTGAYDGTVRVLPTDGGSARATLSLGVPVNAAAVVPGATAADLRVLLAGADGHIRIRNANLDTVADLDIGNGPLTALVVTPDGQTAATAGMRTQVTVLDMTTGKPRFEILGPGLPVWALALSADGTELLTGGQDRIVRRWVTATGTPAGAEPEAVLADALPMPDHPGATVFKACAACHGVTASDTLKAGPTLAGLFGRRIGSLAGYDFSPALRAMDIVWTAETVAELFTRGPLAYTPGTKMPEQRILDATDRAALLDWLAKVTRAAE